VKGEGYNFNVIVVASGLQKMVYLLLLRRIFSSATTSQRSLLYRVIYGINLFIYI
jgi:hypothetical protein